MTTQEIAKRYYELYLQSKRDEIQESLYSEHIINREPENLARMGMRVITTGLEAVKAKDLARAQMIETIHGESCSEPLVAGNFFTVVLVRDITLKGKPRRKLEEIAVFEVKDGKIIIEQFFY